MARSSLQRAVALHRPARPRMTFAARVEAPLARVGLPEQKPVLPGTCAPSPLARARRVDGRALCLAKALGRVALVRHAPVVTRARTRRVARGMHRRTAARRTDDGDGSEGPSDRICFAVAPARTPVQRVAAPVVFAVARAVGRPHAAALPVHGSTP